MGLARPRVEAPKEERKDRAIDRHGSKLPKPWDEGRRKSGMGIGRGSIRGESKGGRGKREMISPSVA